MLITKLWLYWCYNHWIQFPQSKKKEKCAKKQNKNRETLHRTYPGNECCLKEADDLQRDLKADWYQVVVENHKRQEVEYKVTCLQIYKRNITIVNSYQWLSGKLLLFNNQLNSHINSQVRPDLTLNTNVLWNIFHFTNAVVAMISNQ